MAYKDIKLLLQQPLILAFGILLMLPGVSKGHDPFNGSASVFVPFANASSNTDLSDSPKVNISFNGSNQYVPFIMDTGSVGIVASSDLFQPAPGAKNLGKGQQFYSSSGIIEEGTWWSATQNIYDANGNLVATANVPVLQVTSIKCATNSRDCKSENNPKGISVMGIGFARESKQQPRGTPSYNAFLNLQTIVLNGVQQPLPSDWCNGYAVTPTGVYLGLTDQNTANAAFVKLLPWTQYSTSTLPEWMPATMAVSINGISGDGNILMDTGVGIAYLSPPSGTNLDLVDCPGTTLQQCAPNNTVVGVYLPDQTNPVAYYTFTIGQSGNFMQPESVDVVSDSEVFLNTSRHVLGGINFIYDNTNGYIGYIWNGLSGSNVGYVIPQDTPTTTTLLSSANPSKHGKKITFTAQVAGDDPLKQPTGHIEFVIDGERQAPVFLDKSGKATISKSLTPVEHSIVAKYSGDSINKRSKSATLDQRVKPQGF